MTGLIGGSYCFGQLFSNYLWGHISDKCGAKYVIMFSLFMSAMSISAFGLSTTIWQAAGCRVFSGLMNGNCTVIKSYMGRITDTSNQKLGVSVILVSFGLGASVAQLLGGTLASPHKTFPDVFHENSVFAIYPFFLPCACVGLYCVLVVVICLLFLKNADEVQKASRETEVGMKNLSSGPSDLELHEGIGPFYKSIPSAVEESNEKEDEVCHVDKMSEADEDELQLQRLVIDAFSEEELPKYKRNMIITSLAYGWTAFAYMMVDEVVPLFAKMDIQRGGLHYSAKNVGVQLSIYGIFRVGWVLVLIPFSLKALGLRLSYAMSYVGLVPTLLVFPCLNYLAVEEGSSDTWTVWICFLLEQAIRSMCSAHAFSTLILLVTNAVPETHMGKAHGLGQSLAAFGRTIGPLISGSLLTLFYYTMEDWPYHKWYLWIFLSSFGVVAGLVGLCFSASLEGTYRDVVLSRHSSRTSLLYAKEDDGTE